MSDEHFDTDWRDCSAWLQRALDYDKLHGYCLEHVRAEVLAGRAHFWRWPMERELKPSAVAVTHFINYPRLRALHYWLFGGDMASIRAMLPHVENWGLMQGCTRFTGEGRRGFERAFARDGYVPVATLFLKELPTGRLQ